jgi:hypothetical protein
LQRDRNIEDIINAEKRLLKGHYEQLEREDESVRDQEQRDARMHDTHITKDEQRQLNREEDQIDKQIRDDK